MPPKADWPARAEACFAAIEAAALEGRRCPQKAELDHLIGVDPQRALRLLLEQRRVRFWIGGKNWRVAEILTGPAAGKFTARNGLRVHRIVDHDGDRRLPERLQWIVPPAGGFRRRPSGGPLV